MATTNHEDTATGGDPSASSGDAPRRIALRSDQIRNAAMLLVHCARYQFTQRSAEAVRRAIQSDLNWAYLSRAATKHGVEALVYRTLEEVGGDLLPAAVRDEMQQYRRSLQIRNVFIIKELGRVLDLFAGAGIPALTLKGPVLAQTAYGDVNLRRYVDIDVLIPPDRLSAAETVLLENGYRLFDKVGRLGGLKRRLFHYLAQQRPFRRGGGTFNVDLHTQIMPPGLSYPAPFEALWARSQAVTLPGQTKTEVRRFAAEDALMVLCFHGAKNRWAALKYVNDVAALIAASDVAWDLVVTRAREMQVQRTVGLGLLMARQTVGTAIPERVLDGLAVPDRLRAVAERLDERLRTPAHSDSLPYLERVRMYLLLQDTMPHKLRYVLYSAARNIWSAWIQ